MFGQEQQARLLSGRACCSRGVRGPAGDLSAKAPHPARRSAWVLRGCTGEDRPALPAFHSPKRGGLPHVGCEWRELNLWSGRIWQERHRGDSRYGVASGVVMPNWEQYRARALECLELARLTRDPETKSSLMSMAQGWLRMAYSRHVDHFEHLVDDFNQRQMTERPRQASSRGH
jgi:hypothetical protein